MTEETPSAPSVDQTTPPPEEWVPPSKEEWTQAQKAIKAKSEAAERLAKKVAAHEESVRRAEEEAAKARGEYESLYSKTAEELKAAKAELTAYYKAAEDELARIVEGLPEEDRDLVPASLPLADRIAYARRLSSRLVAPVYGTHPAPGSAPSGKGKFGGYDDEMTWASKDPAGYLKAKNLARR